MNRLEMFEDKKVMLVCAETFSWPMHYIAKELRGVVKELNAIYIQPGESYFEAPEYKTFKSLNSDIRIHEMSSVVEQYLDGYKNAQKNIDWKYIDKIEKNYTKYSSLNEQLLSEMTLLPYYHDRDYYEYIDYNKILLYVQFYYQYVEKLFKDNEFDVILDCDVDFFGRVVLLEVASYHNVPYISIDHARIDGYVLPTISLLRKRNYHIEQSFKNYSRDVAISLDTNIVNMYQQMKEDIGDVPAIYKKMYSESKFDIFNMLKRVIVRTLFFFRYFSVKKFKLNLFGGVSSPICSNVIKSYKFTYMNYIRRFYLEYGNVFNTVDLTKINYIYMPLHVIPESSTTVLSPYYINETFIIESLSKSIRPDQYVVVKEHWSMIGHRPISYYNKIKRLPNVILIDPTTYSTPREYINNSDLVVTISGSAALEASVMSVNSLIFCDVTYGLLSSVKKISITSNLREIVAKHIKYKMPEQELYAYIKILLQYGRKVRLKNLLIPPSRVNEKEIEQDITNLIDVFINGIKLHQENKRKEESEIQDYR